MGLQRRVNVENEMRMCAFESSISILEILGKVGEVRFDCVYSYVRDLHDTCGNHEKWKEHVSKRMQSSAVLIFPLKRAFYGSIVHAISRDRTISPCDV